MSSININNDLHFHRRRPPVLNNPFTVADALSAIQPTSVTQTSTIANNHLQQTRPSNLSALSILASEEPATSPSNIATQTLSGSKSPIIAPKIEKSSALYRALEVVTSPKRAQVKQLSSSSANSVYIIAPTPSPSSKESSTPSSDGLRSLSPISPLSPLSPVLETSPIEAEKLKFVFKPNDAAIGNINSKVQGGMQPKIGLLGEDQSLMECVAYLLDSDNIVPATALVTVDFDTCTSFPPSPKATLVESSAPSFLKEPTESKVENDDEKRDDIDSDEEDEDIVIQEFSGAVYDSGESKTALRTGSAQQFVSETISIKEIDPKESDARISRIPLEQVQSIALLDLRTYNTDRHAGNVLINKKNEIFAIDNGCIATRAFKDPAVYCWMKWPKARLPFSKAKKEAIESLDWENIKKVILDSFPEFPKESLITLEFSQFLVQEGTKAGLTPFQIGCFMSGRKLWGGVTMDSPMQTLYEEYGSDPKELKAAIKSLINSLNEKMESLEKQATEKTPLADVIHTFLTDEIGKL